MIVTYCNMFQTHIFKEILNKVLMQCSHSRHVNMIQVWGYNCNKTKLACIDANITSIKTFKIPKKWKLWTPFHCSCQRNPSKMLLFNFKRPLFKTIFIRHHAMCSPVSFCCCNHLSSMLMNVKLIVIQLELNGIGYKLVFHNYSKSASNTLYTLYTLISNFEKCKPNPKKLHGYERISFTRHFL
jgi:hypothetical protein